LGIGDWAQSPIPNPQSPNYQLIYKVINIIINIKSEIYNTYYINYITTNKNITQIFIIIIIL